MLTAVLATAAATLFGSADFLGGLASRKHAALPATILAQAVGLAGEVNVAEARFMTLTGARIYQTGGPAAVDLGPAASVLVSGARVGLFLQGV